MSTSSGISSSAATIAAVVTTAVLAGAGIYLYSEKMKEKAAKDKRWKNVFGVTENQLVSSDIIGNQYAALVDLAFTRVVGGNLVKVLSWYDNEAGYVNALHEHALKSGRYCK